jgi:hypothetical protein
MLKEEDEGLLKDQGKLNIQSNPKFQEIKKHFEMLFDKQSIGENTYFNNKVWFLEKDQDLRKIVTTPIVGDYNAMHDLLTQVSENGRNLKNLRVCRDNFIDAICERILELHIAEEKLDRSIKQWNADEKAQVLKIQHKDIINSLPKDYNSKSLLQVRLRQLDKFPSGKYDFKLNFNVLNPKDVTHSQTYNYSLVNPNSIELESENEIKIFDILSRQSFEDVYFLNHDFTQSDLELKGQEISGSTLSNFSINVHRNETLFALSEPTSFLELFLVNMETLTDYSKITNCEFTTEVKINTLDQSKKYNFKPCYNMKLQMKFDLDLKTRASIFNRLAKEFSHFTNERNSCKYNKGLLLGQYFGETFQSQIEIILKKQDNNNDGICQCQGGCSIY